MQHVCHFDDYIQKNKTHSMHPKINAIYNKFPKKIHGLKNLIFYGPSGVGKYTQVLSCMQKYSPSELKYEKRLTINFNKEQYLIKMSDIHFEIDMSLLGCNAKLLWNEIYTQIIDVIISSPSHNQMGIVVCTYFHNINSELLDNFYSYMQGVNFNRLKFIIVTEHIGFIPDNILNSCKIIHFSKPTAINFNKCSAINLKKKSDKIKNTNNINNITNMDDTLETTGQADTAANAVALNALSNVLLNIKNKVNHKLPHENLCMNIIQQIKNPNELKYLHFRDTLYDIFIYNYDLGECIWYILNDLINDLQFDDISDVLITTYTTFQYFNNNYRPIYHLENYMYNLISKIHGLGKNKN